MELPHARKFYAILATVIIAASVSAAVFAASNPPLPTNFRYSYAVKYICNTVTPAAALKIGLVTGIYWTDINIHNPSYQQTPAQLWKKFVLATPEPQTVFPNPGTVVATPNPYKLQADILSPDAAMRVDCSAILRQISPAGAQITTAKGFVIIYSSVSLDVIAEYSAGSSAGVTSLQVQPITGNPVTP
jgi:hypothetical protein